MHLRWFVIVLVPRLLASDGNRIEMPLIILIESKHSIYPRCSWSRKYRYSGFIPNLRSDNHLGGNLGANIGTRLNPRVPQGFIYYHYLSLKKIICKKTEK